LSNDPLEPPPAQRPLPQDLQVGRRFVTDTYTVTGEQICAFAAQFDPQPFHLDDEGGRASLFGGLVASGWHTAAITMRLLVQSGTLFTGGAVGLGADVSWPHPVRPGDTLQVRAEVLEILPSRSRPERLRVTMRSETCNQHGTVVQVSTAKMLVPRR
jgi:acyl dehydratase